MEPATRPSCKRRRVSYQAGTKRLTEDRGLIRYLMRHRHTTPFEMVELKFHCAMPIFVARQWIRHRTANVNEVSGRYSILPDCFYRPDRDQVCKQNPSNRQGAAEPIGILAADDFFSYLDRAQALYKDYLRLVDQGVAREQARIGLPLSLFTEWYWKIELHNLFHFLSLRLDRHAQAEIRVYAEAMAEMAQLLAPLAFEAFEDYVLGGMRCLAWSWRPCRGAAFKVGESARGGRVAREAKSLNQGVCAMSQPLPPSDALWCWMHPDDYEEEEADEDDEYEDEYEDDEDEDNDFDIEDDDDEEDDDDDESEWPDDPED